MIKNVLPSLRQRAGPQRICSRQKSIRSGAARDSFSQAPHMRGKGNDGSGPGGRLRITPAYAGKRGRAELPYAPAQDHPRVCGEEKLGTLLKCASLGSPPRMRGKELAVGVIRQHGGITPAHAGKRPLSSACICRDWDHPRTCGEKRLMLLVFRAVTGSPPHMRGKGGQTMAKRTGLGITPAHAGKSYRSAFPGTMFRDHPRTCGEKSVIL